MLITFEMTIDGFYCLLVAVDLDLLLLVVLREKLCSILNKNSEV